MMSPSLEGTSAASLTSCVFTDILMTRVKGKTKWTPAGRTSGDTRPKKSFTPTWPAGITVIGLPTRIRTRTTPTIASRTSPRPDCSGGTTSKTFGIAFPPLGREEDAIRVELSAGGSNHLQEVAHLVLLRFEVLARAGGRMDLERHALHDFQPVAADRHVLGRVVRHEPHPPHAQIPQDLAAHAVVAD